MTMDKAIRRQHRRAFLILGSLAQWVAHKATCPDCGGTAPKVEAAPPSKPE
jgi:hypothetical protein